ncbi:hypothetical protein DSO57_1032841 [Entomophthora muscae]|uniref:Uncharacterized protein n=1 Tax=Entomophthora muscae TaxID=34485 RepID=A0ACC2REZ2_9FUNG|nr:hypothetical protein DSO57_1032841 [Entomophthora muscae]
MFKSAILFGTGLCRSSVLLRGSGDIQSSHSQITLYENTTGTIDFNTMMMIGDDMVWTDDHTHSHRKPSHFISGAIDLVSPSGCRTRKNTMYCINVNSQTLEIGSAKRVTDVVQCSGINRCHIEVNLAPFASWEILTNLQLTRAEWTKYFSIFIKAFCPDWLSSLPVLKTQLTGGPPAYLYFKPIRWCFTAWYYHKSINGTVSGYFTVKFPLVSKSNTLLGTYGTVNPCHISHQRASLHKGIDSNNLSTYINLLNLLC